MGRSDLADLRKKYLQKVSNYVEIEFLKSIFEDKDGY